MFTIRRWFIAVFVVSFLCWGWVGVPRQPGDGSYFGRGAIGGWYYGFGEWNHLTIEIVRVPKEYPHGIYMEFFW